MALYDWSQIEKERVSPDVSRQVVHGVNVTIAKFYLAKGAVVPEHSHVNEQIALLVRGRLRFIYPDHDQIVEAGQMIATPPSIRHSVEALEESLAIDVFAPRREDWIRGEDAFPHK
jgi:quercetin dioxygenase-like cupin family protein